MTDERIIAALDAELERRAGGGDHLAPAGPLSPDEQVELNSLLDVADLLWESTDNGAPALEDDPTALMLGLVPDPAITINVAALKRHRQNAGLKTSELAAQLVERGWNVTTQEVFAWETKSATWLSPALIRAITDVLGVDVETITQQREVVGKSIVEKVSVTQWFLDLCWTWARRLDIDFSSARSALLGQMAATVNRGKDLTEYQWREVLEHLDPSTIRPSN